MALVLVATVGAPDANAYADQAETIEFASYRADGSAFIDETSDEQIQDLVSAATTLDSFPLVGERASDTQALEFPRTGTDNFGSELPSDDIPTAWWKANMALAIYFANQRAAGNTADLINPAVNNRKRVKSGEDEIEFFAPKAELAEATALDWLPMEVQRYLGAFVIAEVASGWGSAVVTRTS